ncbi:hypothetical protein [Gemmatimonas sp.]|uniref:hypothetical protein n=1 Tax=Gemmatimonas sp. TaxID=1962908 RepID=UPI00356B2A0A
MNPFSATVRFSILEAAPSTPSGPAASLFTYDDAEPIERLLLDELNSLPEGGLLIVDFDGVRAASEAARQLLRRPLLRLFSGELKDRYLVLDHLEKCRYSVDAMLEKEELVAVARTAEGPLLRGAVEGVAAETYAYAVAHDEVTAKMVFDHFELQGLAAATNRLTNLARLGVIRRTGIRSLPAGGREYLYVAIQ